MQTLYKIKPISERKDSNSKWQAERMVSRSNKILRPIDIGDNVTIPLPSVDRGHGDLRNILCLVTHFCSNIKQYKRGTRHGLLNSTFSRNNFMSSTFHGLFEAEVDSNTESSV